MSSTLRTFVAPNSSTAAITDVRPVTNDHAARSPSSDPQTRPPITRRGTSSGCRSPDESALLALLEQAAPEARLGLVAVARRLGGRTRRVLNDLDDRRHRAVARRVARLGLLHGRTDGRSRLHAVVTRCHGHRQAAGLCLERHRRVLLLLRIFLAEQLAHELTQLLRIEAI